MAAPRHSRRRRAWQPLAAVGAPSSTGGRVFANNLYRVVKRSCGTGPLGTLWHLSIRNQENTADHDWRDFQRIKNELVGPEAEAVELYPAESRKVDAANQYHLWCFEDPAFRFPFGFGDRLVTEQPFPGTVQRPFEPE